MRGLLLQPVGMSDSFFGQPAPPAIPARVATGHSADGSELPGGWRVMPELAAAGMWPTPTDLAKLLIVVSQAFRGQDNRLLDRQAVRTMQTPQNGSFYGLGGSLAGSDHGTILATALLQRVAIVFDWPKLGPLSD